MNILINVGYTNAKYVIDIDKVVGYGAKPVFQVSGNKYSPIEWNYNGQQVWQIEVLLDNGKNIVMETYITQAQEIYSSLDKCIKERDKKLEQKAAQKAAQKDENLIIW